MPVPPSPFKHSGQIVTTFDAAAGGMKTALEHPRPLGGAQGSIYLGATFVHPDPRRVTRPTFELALLSSSKGERFRGSHQVVLVADGRPVPVAAAANYRSRSAGQGTVLELVSVTLPLDDLSSLTGARRVTTRVGGEEFELTENHLEALREFASLIGGTSKKGWRTE